MCPDDVTRALMSYRRAACRGEGFLVSWSRSTSASSIYRYHVYSHVTTPPVTLLRVNPFKTSFHLSVHTIFKRRGVGSTTSTCHK